MANWQQVQVRIRKAKAGDNPQSALTELFQETHDGMVAFELGRLVERTGASEEAVRWYTEASGRFRRAEWRKKAREALERLGAPVPVEAAETGVGPPKVEPSGEASLRAVAAGVEPQAQPAPEAAPLAVGGVPGGRGRTRRGRRGGRRHRRRRGAATQPQAAQVGAAAPEEAAGVIQVEQLPEPAPARTEEEEGTRPIAEPVLRGRAGDPGLASRLARLESHLRRLIASPLHRVEDAEGAPAGPGVFLLSDADQTTYYYAEACRTLRVALGQLLRGGRGTGDLRNRLAENLGISESRVSKYLKEHCVVRWMQLDEGAAQLAHFVMAVLRPVLND